MTHRDGLERIVGRTRVLTRPFELAAFSCDASFYTLTPKAVVRPQDTKDVAALFAWSRRERIPLTFRAGGTSLSGQAVTEGVLLDLSRDWRALEVLEDGARVRVGPGVVGGFVNAHLARHGTKLGPDPASINACMIGGIVANNSSGMCCGIEKNAYRTLESLRFVLPSGTEIDTARPEAAARFAHLESEIARGLMHIRSKIHEMPMLAERIRAKHRMKNTMGYSLNAFLDFDTPLDILWHLLVGSEGTLAFIAEAVFHTIPDLPGKTTGLLFFETVPRACEAIEPLRAAGAAALELMDGPSLRSIAGKPAVPALAATIPRAAAAILAEFQAGDDTGLTACEEAYRAATPDLPLIEPTQLTRDATTQAGLWAARKGLIASVGATRRSGTSVIFEDVTFPLEHLAAGVADLQHLFEKHDYPDGIVFGHAKDGNVHFLLSQSFNDQASIDQYARFTDDLVAMVVDRYDGALKAEHGTGRNMAPFVERVWGSELYGIMREVKRLIDPDGILNPGVLLNDDPKVHLANLKSLPTVEDEIDRCIECGFCESRCPSRDLTLTPRQRIVLRREQARRRAAGHSLAAAVLEEGLEYAMVDTCAADGMCATACPVGIDTGSFIKHLRASEHGAASRAIAHVAASSFGIVEALTRAALSAGIGPEELTADKPKLPRSNSTAADAIYFPSCVTRVLGSPAGTPPLAETIVRVASRSDLHLRIPDDIAGVCCGMPFSSKGFETAHAVAANRAIERMAEWSDGGRLPILIDTSPCAWSLATCRHALSPKNQRVYDRLTILDSVAFAHGRVLPKLPIVRRLPRVAVHPVCSVVKLGLAGKLEACARSCAESVVVPLAAGCCGFAGDRGFTHPELTAAATASEAAELARAGVCDRYVSTSRTCEIGMTRATGKAFVSLWHLFDEMSRTA